MVTLVLDYRSRLEHNTARHKLRERSDMFFSKPLRMAPMCHFSWRALEGCLSACPYLARTNELWTDHAMKIVLRVALHYFDRAILPSNSVP